jgi:outer membrane protein assembly complex protein YaeT
LVWALLAAASGSFLVAEAAPAKDSLKARFEGHDAFSSSRLAQVIEADLEDYRQQPRDSFLDDAAFDLQDLYQREGYVEVSVSFERKAKEVIFRIQEGPRTLVEALYFDGAKSFPEDQLKSFFASTRTGLTGRSAGPYSPSRLREEAAALQAFYRGGGFLDARVGPPTATLDEQSHRARVTIPVEEGPRFILRNLDLEGTELLPPATLEALKKEYLERPYHPRFPFEIRGRLQSSFGKKGYADAVCEMTPNLDRESGAVTLEVVCVPGNEVVISEIILSGNERTRDSFILARLGLKEGEVYSQDKERGASRRLYRSGLFRSLSISLAEGEEARRALLVEVEEVSPREIFIEPGFGSYEGLRLRLGWRENNLFGLGSRLLTDLTGSERALRASVSYLAPWLSREDWTTESSLSFSERQLDGFTSSKIGAGVALRREWSSRLTTTFGYQLRRSAVLDLKDVQRDETVSLQDVNLSSLTSNARYDDRDNVFVPTRGWFSEMNLEFAAKSLGSDREFFRGQWTVSVYQPLSKSLSGALSLRGGAIAPLGTQDSIPLQERFLSGGENSVRAFQEGRLLPVGDDGVPLVDEEGNSLGGEAFWTLTAELRQRVWGNLQGALFLDAGALVPKAKDFFNPYEVRSGVGLGLRYLLPIGPLRLDGAWNLDRKEGEDRFVVHFSVGMAI